MNTKPLCLMIQATGSDAGKSLFLAGLARAATKKGLAVRPFKPQNMSNNAAVVQIGYGEIGRAQQLQAQACRIPSSVHMNPILLKPQGNQTSQVIVQGKYHQTLLAEEYYAQKEKLLSRVMESFHSLQDNADLILIEGAGSASEINLRHADIANMGFASHIHSPVILIGDIHRGGVIASLVGTHQLLSKLEKQLVKGFIINKFRGNQELFTPALNTITSHTSWDSLGILPWFDNASQLPAEDSMALDSLTPPKNNTSSHTLHIAVPLCPHIANFDDIDPLRLEPHVQISLVKPHNTIPQNTDVIILPGSKNTIKDLAFIRSQGWDIDILAHARHHKWILGLCGGFQMLGHSLHDPLHLEGTQSHTKGLGLLPILTTLSPHKKLSHTQGICNLTQQPLAGYEIHMGVSSPLHDHTQPFALIGHDKKPEGAIHNHTFGTYLHGIFAHDNFRHHMIALWKNPLPPSSFSYTPHIDNLLDELADHIDNHLNTEKILSLAEPCL